jgi:hypothetical protein
MAPNQSSVINPDPFNVRRLMLPNQPSTIELEYGFDAPLPTLPAPVEFK